MSDATGNTGEPKKGGGLFDYTQRAYWGGPWYPYWTLILMTIFGGLFGLDHLYLRSPLSAIAKFVFNIFSLGLWWVYDMLQILGEPESVQKNGLSIPIYGAAGIGSGMFTDDQPGVTTSRSPLRWFAYMFLVFLPFGFDLFIAGDTNGALAKFIASITWFLIPIAMIWSALNIGKAWLTPKAIWEDGSPRMFPFTFFMDAKGRSVLGPVDVPLSKDGCDPGGVNGVFSSIIGMFTGFIGTVLTPFVQTAINLVLPGVVPATAAAATAVTAGATAAKVGLNTASAVIEKSGDVATAVLDAAKNPAAQMAAVTVDLAQKAPSAAAAIPGLASGVGTGLADFKNPDALKKAAGIQTGGGASDELGHIALLSFFLIVLGSGAYFAAKRLNIHIPFLNRPEPNGPQRNDAPPKP